MKKIIIKITLIVITMLLGIAIFSLIEWLGIKYYYLEIYSRYLHTFVSKFLNVIFSPIGLLVLILAYVLVYNPQNLINIIKSGFRMTFSRDGVEFSSLESILQNLQKNETEQELEFDKSQTEIFTPEEDKIFYRILDNNTFKHVVFFNRRFNNPNNFSVRKLFAEFGFDIKNKTSDNYLDFLILGELNVLVQLGLIENFIAELNNNDIIIDSLSYTPQVEQLLTKLKLL